MGFVELFLIAVGLSMDAFAVSICKGLAVQALRPRHMLLCGVYFGGFQALMPFIGWLLGIRFQGLIASVDHWVAFILLGVIGFNMIREAMSDEPPDTDASFGVKSMLLLPSSLSRRKLTVGG